MPTAQGRVRPSVPIEISWELAGLTRCNAAAVRDRADEAECIAQRDHCTDDFDEPPLATAVAACNGVAGSIFHEDCGAPVRVNDDCLLEVVAIKREENLSCERSRELKQRRMRQAALLESILPR